MKKPKGIAVNVFANDRLIKRASPNAAGWCDCSCVYAALPQEKTVHVHISPATPLHGAADAQAISRAMTEIVRRSLGTF